MPRLERSGSMRVAVDLTAVLPGGRNGGLKPLVLSLLRDLIARAPDVEFVVLTSSAADAELACLDADNARRLCVAQSVDGAQTGMPPAGTALSFRRRLRLRMTRVLPSRLMLWIELAYLASIGKQPKRTGLLTELGANLLFNPFPNLAYHEPGVPSVSLVHDLQVYQYPRFFRPDQRAALHRELQRAARLSDRLVCTSAFVYRTVLQHADVPSARLVTIQPRTISRLTRVEEQAVDDMLARHGLSRDGFLLYPGRFWPHKNHGMLLTAFAIYVVRNPETNLRLVCPGEIGPEVDELMDTTRAMGLGDRVMIPGFVSDPELAALYQACRAVVVPSLYGGLSLLVMEAMAFNKPVLCARHPSLEELAGQAAIYFDPRLLSDLVQAIELAAQEPPVLHPVTAASDEPASTAEEFLRLFYEVAA